MYHNISSLWAKSVPQGPMCLGGYVSQYHCSPLRLLRLGLVMRGTAASRYHCTTAHSSEVTAVSGNIGMYLYLCVFIYTPLLVTKMKLSDITKTNSDLNTSYLDLSDHLIIYMMYKCISIKSLPWRGLLFLPAS